MKFLYSKEHCEWLETGRTHEECYDCALQYVTPTPCRPHPDGENPCRFFKGKV